MMRNLALFTLVLAVPSINFAESGKPNIVFVLADDVGCEPLGCYGGTSYPTPNLDRLAESGMRFRHCYSLPVCHPTRTTFLTGRYPLHTGNPRWGSFPKSLDEQTVAHRMKQAGYATVVAGKWQLALLGKDLRHPHRLGFDEYCLFGWHEGARYHDPLIWQNGEKPDGTEGRYGPDIYVDFLIDFIGRHREQPFFAFYSMALCHDVTDDLKGPVPYSPGKNRYDNYGEMIAAMDRCVGRVVDALDRLELREKTLILFTGDNGTAKGSIIRAEKSGNRWKYIREPVYSEVDGKRVPGGKGNLTSDGTNVPLICNWVGTVKAGQVVDDLVDFSDFYATFSQLARSTPPISPAIDGQSFAPRLLGDGPAPRAWAFSQGRGKHWVRTQRWKLYNDGRFFDVETDPAEKRNLAGAVPSAGSGDFSILQKALSDL
jgi:arylsulfatase A-like enzyme